MRYRKFGRIDWEVSALAFGAMRLPTTDGAFYSQNVDEPQAIALIRHAIDRGVNFLDSAYVYHGGKSEVVLGKALLDGYRQKVKVCTKCPTPLLERAGDYDRFLELQMKRLQLDQIDFYLFHGVSKDRWDAVLRLGALESAEAAVADGRIAHIGFSFHDDTETFKKVVDAYDGWGMCLIQHNYMDTKNQAGTEGLCYAAAKGIAVAIMEPLLGGSLADPPEEVRKIFRAYPEQRSYVEWALAWLWDQPEVATVFSGMSSLAQVDENIEVAERAELDSFSAEDDALIEQVREAFRGRAPLPCTTCGYCMPCEHGIDIPRNFEIYNDAMMFGSRRQPGLRYKMLLKPGERAENCTGCAECEEKCPQGIAISECMHKVHELLGGQSPPLPRIAEE